MVYLEAASTRVGEGNRLMPDEPIMEGSQTPVVSVIIIAYSPGNELLRCLASLREQDVPMEILIVDNGSGQGTVRAAEEAYPEATVVRSRQNLGYSGGANLGAGRARGDYLLFLNPDVHLAPGAVRLLVDGLSRPQVGVCGPVVYQEASMALDYGSTIDALGNPIGLPALRPPLFVQGCALATRADLFEIIHGFDERYFMFVEDVDYCWRVLLAGFDVRVVEDAKASHIGGASAPGGYPSAGRLTTTRFRLALRERNTLATLLKCYHPATLTLVLPLYILQAVGTAILLALARRRGAPSAVMQGLFWNIRHLRQTLRLRRATQVTRRVPDRVIRQRMRRGWRRIELAREVGIPTVLDR